MNFHAEASSIFHSLPENGKIWSVAKKIIVIMVAPFAYLALGFIALIGLIFDSKLRNRKICKQAENKKKSPPLSISPGVKMSKDSLQEVDKAKNSTDSSTHKLHRISTSIRNDKNVKPHTPFSSAKERPTTVSSSPNSTSSIPQFKNNLLSEEIRRFSSNDSTDPTGGVYITTNESNLPAVRKILLNTPKVSESCHIGFSGWYNFDIMALRESAYGLICDFNPENKIFLEKTLELLKSSQTREIFVKAIRQYIQSTPIRFEFNVGDESSAQDSDEEVRNELTREGSWLSNDKGFEHIKTLAKQDKIAVITQNICNSHQFQKIAKIYQDNGISIDTLYLSNIWSPVSMEGEKAKKSYLSTVHYLIKPNTKIINCISGDLQQRIFLGKDLQGHETDERWFR